MLVETRIQYIKVYVNINTTKYSLNGKLNSKFDDLNTYKTMYGRRSYASTHPHVEAINQGEGLGLAYIGRPPQFCVRGPGPSHCPLPRALMHLSAQPNPTTYKSPVI